MCRWAQDCETWRHSFLQIAQIWSGDKARTQKTWLLPPAEEIPRLGTGLSGSGLNSHVPPRVRQKKKKKKTWSKISTFGKGCGYPLAQDSICQQFGVIGPPRPEEAREDNSQPASSCVLDSVGRKTIVRGNPLVCDCQWFMMLLCFKGEQWGTQSLSKNIMRFTLISKSLSPPHFRVLFWFFFSYFLLKLAGPFPSLSFSKTSQKSCL